MKATLILVILGLSLIICDTGDYRSFHLIYQNTYILFWILDAKGFGYKRMKSPGRSMKVPKSRKGLGMGMAMGAGMGLGMGTALFLSLSFVFVFFVWNSWLIFNFWQ